MQLVKLITLKKTKTLRCYSFFRNGLSLTLLVLFFSVFSTVKAQDNSPYSRYGIGNLVPNTNIANRAIGGISAGFADPFSINFNNPASFAAFQSAMEANSKKLTSGRAILDVGINVDNRTLREPGNPIKFTANNALFSYVQVGVPLKRNWGMSFGLRPLSRISYKIKNNERLYNPIPPYNAIDSAATLYHGDGGSYLASMGTGFSLFSRRRKSMEEKLSVGITGGYMFGTKDYSARRTLINDTVTYLQANYETKTSFNGLFINTGFQYQVPIDSAKRIMLTLGASGHWGQQLNASQDQLRETFYYDQTLGNTRLDSVSDKTGVNGKIDLPASYTFGFVLQKYPIANKTAGWLLGVDFEQQNWAQYRFYGQKDSVQKKWELRVGAQFNPVPKRNYFSNVAYRLGFFTGPDYIKVGNNLSQFGASFGLGLPLTISRQAPNQLTFINLAFEYIKRGNNDNLLKENLFRVSFGFSLSDIWFIKRKYE